jgi:hypothetical protein
VSKRLGSPYRSGCSKQWVKVKNPAAPPVRREADEDLGALTTTGIKRAARPEAYEPPESASAEDDSEPDAGSILGARVIGVL